MGLLILRYRATPFVPLLLLSGHWFLRFFSFFLTSHPFSVTRANGVSKGLVWVSSGGVFLSSLFSFFERGRIAGQATTLLPCLFPLYFLELRRRRSSPACVSRLWLSLFRRCFFTLCTLCETLT